MISCVVISAAEAELGAAFQNAQKGAQFRNTLIELGYPQQPTPILVDNTVAEGLANNTVNAKRSKSIDVRFFWLRDRVKHGEFTIQHLKGRWNISDFSTKSLHLSQRINSCNSLHTLWCMSMRNARRQHDAQS
jgi:hypothetical protein